MEHEKHLTYRSMLSLIGITLLMASPISIFAQDNKSGGDLRAAVQNPISSLYSLPFKFSFDYGAEDGEASFLNIQPVLPVTVGEWNLVNRIILPIIDVPGSVTGIPENPSPIPGNGASGLGDTNYSLYFSPVKVGKVTWGVGPSISMPTAVDDQLGTGKWSAGLTAVALAQPDWGSVGILGRHLWSFAGDVDRRKVNQTLIEPFANYNLEKGWFLLTDLIITANWEAPSGEEWMVPLGGGAGRVFKIGNQPVNMRAEAYYNVAKPDGAPDWQWSFTVQLLFPK